jgi:hypothetical protein
MVASSRSSYIVVAALHAIGAAPAFAADPFALQPRSPGKVIAAIRF